MGNTKEAWSSNHQDATIVF